MWTKRVLIFLPIAVSVFLLQSYFWVPTYEQQARATPDRLSQYITASTADAEILNPILNADVPSSTIVGQVFEGLIDRDENLNWRGRLATSWAISEEAYFVLNPKETRSAPQIVALLLAEREKRKGEDSPLGRTWANIMAVTIEPAKTVTESTSEQVGEDADKNPKYTKVTLTVQRPTRVKLTLKNVDQDLFTVIEPVIGPAYFSTFKDREAMISVTPKEFEKDRARYADEYLAATEHDPVIVFNMRKGVKFHDNHEVDSGDVKFTYDAIMDSKNLSPRVSDYEPVKSVEAVDKYTVRITYKRLFSPAFGAWAMQILPEHLLNDDVMRKEAEKKGKKFDEFNMRDSDFNRHPIGCGPFKFVQWKSDQFIELTRFDGYWEGPPVYKTYTYRIVPDPITEEMEFYAGAVDNYGVQPHQVARLRHDPRFQSFSGLRMGYTYIGYNMRRDLFKDKRVRRALGMAVNTNDIIKYVLYDQAEPITGPFVKQTDFYDQTIKPLPHDPEAAKRLLAEAGWKPGKDGWLEKDGRVFRFTLIASSGGGPVTKSIMALAQDAWKKIGIDAKSETIEWSVFIAKYIDQADFDACVLGWSMDIEPDLYQIWHSSQTNPKQLNFVGFKNKEADDLIVRIRQEYDHTNQVKLCHQLHQIIADEQPYTFLFVGKWTALLDKRIFVAVRDKQGDVIGYEKIKPTKTGDYGYYFNRWIKLPHVPQLSPE